ncbi:MAG TPA: hypothetical protein VJ877_06900 [Bacteroidales bacterium]|nr:hypothetical protein [Bacteroidales bacterium]
MKEEKMKDLFLKSLTDDLNPDQRDALDAKLFPSDGFNPGFRERVMKVILAGRVLQEKGRKYFDKSLNSLFVRVSLAGAAAIIVLVLSLLLSQGSLSYDTLLGIDNNVDGMLVSLATD